MHASDTCRWRKGLHVAMPSTACAYAFARRHYRPLMDLALAMLSLACEKTTLSSEKQCLCFVGPLARFRS